MGKEQIIKDFIAEIRTTFPGVGDRMDTRMKDLGFDAEEYMFTEMMECFSQVTTDAIKAKNSESVLNHLNYISKKLETASEIEKEYIDVYYTEPLMWDIKDQKLRSWGWQLFPKNIKQRYEGLWGEQNF